MSAIVITVMTVAIVAAIAASATYLCYKAIQYKLRHSAPLQGHPQMTTPHVAHTTPVNDTDTGEFVTIAVNQCARCGENHPPLSFKRAYLTPDDSPGILAWTHWALCPTTGDPILMIVVNND
jgi:hypothetical protein